MNRRLRQLTLAVLVGAGLMVGCGGEPTGREQASRALQPPPGWTTYSDDRRGYEVSFPSGWHRARSRLTDVVDPREILSLATYPLRQRGRGRCYAPIDAPTPALDDFGPRDAIISIQERRSRDGGEFPARRRPFWLPPLDLRYPAGAPNCTAGRVRWIAFHPFRDGGRNFYAFAAAGRAASHRTRRDLRRVLESLVFERRPPHRRAARGHEIDGRGAHRDAERGYEIDLPDGWQRAGRNIVPRLTDPRQVVAFGTYPLRHRPTPRCEAFAGSAREDLGPDDVLGVVMERGLDPSSEWSEFVPRPTRFGPTDPRGAETGCGDRPGTTSDWIPFTASGRHFYALLVFGTAVTDSRREQAYRTLDSLSLDPGVRPDWPSSG